MIYLVLVWVLTETPSMRGMHIISMFTMRIDGVTVGVHDRWVWAQVQFGSSILLVMPHNVFWWMTFEYVTWQSHHNQQSINFLPTSVVWRKCIVVGGYVTLIVDIKVPSVCVWTWSLFRSHDLSFPIVFCYDMIRNNITSAIEHVNIGWTFITVISIFNVFLCHHIPILPLVDNDFLTQFKSY